MHTFKLILIHLLVYGLLAAASMPLSITAGVFAILLIWISVWDFLTFEIPDTGVFLLAASGTYALFGKSPVHLIDGIVGGMLWPLLFWAVASLYHKSRGIQGLGFGDVKLMVGIGLWCGASGTIYVVLTSALAGLVVLSVLAVVHSTSIRELGQSKVAFGPFLCLSAWSVWLIGGSI